MTDFNITAVESDYVVAIETSITAVMRFSFVIHKEDKIE